MLVCVLVVAFLAEIMDVYRVAVLQVQQEILHSNAVPVLASIQYFLTDFTVRGGFTYCGCWIRWSEFWASLIERDSGSKSDGMTKAQFVKCT